MGIQVVWENEAKTLLRVIYDGKWSVAEFFDTYESSIRMMTEAGHSLVLILDMTSSDSPPTNFFGLINVVRRNPLPCVERVIIIKGYAPFRSIAVALQKIMPIKQRRLDFAESLDDAYALAMDVLHQSAQAAL